MADDAPGQAGQCPICDAAAAMLDVVDFNKCCEETRGIRLPLSGRPIYYCLCPACGFCFAPQMYGWSVSEFEERVYNDGYQAVDPDYVQVRPEANAASLLKMLPQFPRDLRHLDYGGGGGLLSRILRDAGWDSTSYDPFVDVETTAESLGAFDLITAYEVFEHVPDVAALMATLTARLKPGGMVLFTTLLSDGQIGAGQRLTWWYAAPRNGHISLFSRRSLAQLTAKYGFQFGSFSDGFHALWRTPPDWARHLIR
jgi:SAM-dependent methyltransferase